MFMIRTGSQKSLPTKLLEERFSKGALLAFGVGQFFTTKNCFCSLQDISHPLNLIWSQNANGIYQSQNHEHSKHHLAKDSGDVTCWELGFEFSVNCHTHYLQQQSIWWGTNWSSASLNCKVSSLGGWLLYRERRLNGSCLTSGWSSLSWPNKVADSHPASAGLAPALASHILESAGAGQILTSVWKPLTWDTITSWAVTVMIEGAFLPLPC